MLDEPDRETLALQELARRRSRLKMRVLCVFLLIGLPIGFGGYLLVREAQFAMTDNGSTAVSFPYLSGVGFLVPFLLFGFIGRWVAMAMLRMRMPAWVDDLARLYAVERDLLTRTTDLLAELDGAPVD
jgi:hypothetical protein